MKRISGEKNTTAIRESFTGNIRSESATLANFIDYNQTFSPYLADERILAPIRAVFGPNVRMRSGKGFVEASGTQRSR